MTIGSNGELSEAEFELFGFDPETGQDYKKDTVQVTG